MRIRTHARASRALLLAAALLLLSRATPLSAGDHADSPGTIGDPAADIGDLYAFPDRSGRILTVIFTYGGLIPPTGEALFDRNVLYTLHLDNDQDGVADTQVRFRFGQDDDGGWGMQVTNLPGGSSRIVGRVPGTTGHRKSSRTPALDVFAGLMDDPFFFDREGYEETLATGQNAFDPRRDTHSGLNTMAIAVTMSLAHAQGNSPDTPLDLWVTTGRR